MNRGGMDAYDEGSSAGHRPDGPDGPASAGPDMPNAPNATRAPDAPNATRAPDAPAATRTPDARDKPNAPDVPNVPDGPAPDGPVHEAPADQEPAGQEPAPEWPTAEPPAAAPGSLPAEPPAPAGIAALPLRHQIAAALALAVVGVAACVHLGMVFLHVAPSNTVTKQHGRAIDEWVYPEFEQNWKLFAPNPLQQNIAIQVRALVRTTDGTSSETGWYDLSALDGHAIDGNLLPSHTQQNELRRAWDFYIGTHDTQNRPAGLRGDLSERYLRRVVVLRLDREHAGGAGAVVERVQVRSRTTNVPPPKWSEEQVSDKPMLRELPWWAVPAGEPSAELTEASAR